MDELQDRLVQLGLATSPEDTPSRFMGSWSGLSEDVDLFTNRWDPSDLRQAVDAVAEAYRLEGLESLVVRQAETFARLQAVDPGTEAVSSVDMAADFRGHEPVELSMGLVLAEPDAE